MANYQYIESTGVIIPDTSELLTEAQNEFKDALGGDLSVNPSTPQGLLITARTLAREAVVRNNAALANQINPNLAGGVFLDAICALTGLERTTGSRSLISDVVLTGEPSTVIAAGVQAKTVLGDLFESLGAVVLDGTGMATVDFQSVEIGPISAAIGALNQIVTNVLGWENVANPNAAVLGTSEQSDQSLRAKRRNTLALQGVAISEAITSAVYDVPEVKSLVFRENYTNLSRTIDGVTLLPHSIFVCVDGGEDTEIALALLENKSAGANWNGNTTIVVNEPVSGQAYSVKFSRPDEITILIKATVKADTSILDPQTIVQRSILAYINGDLEGEPGFVVGGDVSTFELASAINRDSPGIYVQKIEISKLSPLSYTTNEIPIEIFEVARSSISNIQVIIA